MLFVRLLTAVVAALTLSAQGQNPIYSQAVEALQRGQPAQAVSLLEPVITQSPNDVRALTLLGMALTAGGKPDAANQRFTQALAVSPGFVPALRGLAMNQMAAGNIREAKVRFLEMIKAAPQDPLANLALGEIFFAEKNYSSAAQHFDLSGAALFQDPQNVLKYAVACVNSKQLQKAIDVLSKLPAGADAVLHYDAGLLLAKAGRYDEAVRHLSIAASRHSDPYAAGYNLALAQLRAEKAADAVQTLEQLAARGFRKAELYNLLSRSYEASGRTKEAYDALRTATEIDPAEESNYIDLIALCLDHRNLDLAQEIAAIGLKRLPGSARLHLQEGVVYAMKGQFEVARRSFGEAAKLGPSKSLPQVSLGLVLMQMDKPAEAIEVLRRGASAAPKDYLVLWFLAEAISRAGADPGSAAGKEAITALTRSIQLNGTLAEPRILLAKMLARRGDLAGAADQLERALKLEPENISATYQLAQVLARKGERERSKELFAKVSKAKAEERDQFATRGLQQIVREGAR